MLAVAAVSTGARRGRAGDMAGRGADAAGSAVAAAAGELYGLPLAEFTSVK